MTSVKELVTSVKVLVTLGKTKTGIPSGACELYQSLFCQWVVYGCQRSVRMGSSCDDLYMDWFGWKLCMAARMPPEILFETELGGAAIDKYASLDKG